MRRCCDSSPSPLSSACFSADVRRCGTARLGSLQGLDSWSRGGGLVTPTAFALHLGEIVVGIKNARGRCVDAVKNEAMKFRRSFSTNVSKNRSTNALETTIYVTRQFVNINFIQFAYRVHSESNSTKYTHACVHNSFLKS